MNILAAIKREERKLQKQLAKLQNQLNGAQAAGKSLGAFDQPRDSWGQEARPVSCWPSGDCQGGEKAVGEG
jgi:hypothetical protein